MGYYIDLSSISLDIYKEKLKLASLIPSRIILKDKIDERFDYFNKIGIKNLKELQQLLRKKNEIAKLSTVAFFKDDYLVILLREINSLHPKPNKISEFGKLSSEIASSLEIIGIKDTMKLFDKVKNKNSRKILALNTGLTEKDVFELAKLTDLSRIKWVGAAFAWVLFECGYDTVEKVSNADYGEIYRKVKQLNMKKNLYKGQIGLNDMKVLVDAAKDVPLEIDFNNE
jgi:hypothetical protein